LNLHNTKNQKYFAEIRSVTSEYSAIYADGSKDGYRVGSAAVFGQQVYSARIPSTSSIFSAEANAIHLALKFVASSEKSKFMICSDLLSCPLAIESCKTQNTFILKIVEIYKSLVAIGKHVIFTWIPSQLGNAFRVICYEFAGPSYLANVLKYISLSKV
jgi:hypothetical protein